MMTTSLLLRLLINSHIWSTRRRWGYISTWYTYLIYKTIGKYTTKYDTMKLNNKTCYTIPKLIIMVHKAQGNNNSVWSSCLLILVKKMDMGQKSSMLDHDYWFAIREYDMSIMNEDHIMTEKYITWLFAKKVKIMKLLLMQWGFFLFFSSSLSCSSPRWDNLPSGHQRYSLKGINSGYMYWGQKHSSE